MVPAAECLTESATVLDVAVRADQGGSSPILVLSEGKCAGAIDARAVASAFAAGEDPGQLSLAEVLVRRGSLPRQTAVPPETSALDARRALILNGAEYLTVVQDGEVLGIVDWASIADATYEAPDGFPLPPAELMRMVAGGARQRPRPRRFFEGGRSTAEAIETIVARYGKPIASCEALLDFGCGCGRLIRHWHGLSETELHGCDYNPELLAWCLDNLPFAKFELNELQPPLPYSSESFDLVVAMSVFTHLTEELQFEWLAELRRVLKPGGMLLLSTHGESRLPEVDADGRGEFRAGHLVVRESSAAGSNRCNSFHPREYVQRTLSRDFELLAHLPDAARNMRQDVVLMARPR
jgi:SAM-dependent methyltransferase